MTRPTFRYIRWRTIRRDLIGARLMRLTAAAIVIAAITALAINT